MKLTKRLIALILCVTAVFSTTFAYAAAIGPDSSINITPYQGWTQLNTTSNSFDISSKGMASMSAETIGFSSSTEVTVAMYLERLQNGKWTTVSGMSWSDSETSEFVVVLSKTRAVVSGYNYRLRSEHSATGPNGTETDTIYSGAIYY